MPELEFYITDHSADYARAGRAGNLRRLYADIKKNGIGSIRYDWHWKKIEPERGRFNTPQLARYKKAKKIMEEVGLGPPTVIFSNFPGWAIELYKADKNEFFAAYRAYLEKSKEYLETAGEGKVERIQILNELNNRVYNLIAVEDLPRLCWITREVFLDYNQDLHLIASLLISNLSSGFRLSRPIEKYLADFEKVRESFDIVSVNYFPGLWHWPIKEVGLKYHEWFNYLGKLRQIFEIVAEWDMEYELGEFGSPTNGFWGNEAKQKKYYNIFFRELGKMLEDFRKRGMRLPSRIGLFEAADEEPQTAFARIIGRNFSPEYDMGLWGRDGRRKNILTDRSGNLKSIIEHAKIGRMD